jgi:tyrosyl-tRNA synthetase
VPEVRVPAEGGAIHLPALLVDHLGVASTSEARRLIAQGGVRLDGEAFAEVDVDAGRLDGALVQAGKRRFARVFVDQTSA